MLQVFRVEHKETRIGPFQTPDAFTQHLARQAGQFDHLKNPGDDGLPLAYIPFCYVFGCPDLTALQQWILLGETSAENQNIVQELRDRGFVLAEYLVESDRYRMGLSQTQLAFDADDCRDANLVEFRDLGDLLPGLH